MWPFVVVVLLRVAAVVYGGLVRVFPKVRRRGKQSNIGYGAWQASLTPRGPSRRSKRASTAYTCGSDKSIGIIRRGVWRRVSRSIHCYTGAKRRLKASSRSSHRQSRSQNGRPSHCYRSKSRCVARGSTFPRPKHALSRRAMRATFYTTWASSSRT